MTLLYWWMHWFWITYQVHYLVSCDKLTTLHSPLDQIPSNATNEWFKNRVIDNLKNPPINNTSNSSLTIVKETKHSLMKKLEFRNMTNKLNATKMYSKKPVINQNLTESNNITIDNHFNTTDNLTYFGDDNFNINNNSILFNSERIGIDNNLNDDNLSVAGITGITLGCVLFFGILCGISYLIYRNRGFNNRPQVLNDRCSNPDSSGYIDDASVRDNSEEMYSLDNDSFLNSLEAMTIQNYWTDTVKHTKNCDAYQTINPKSFCSI